MALHTLAQSLWAMRSALAAALVVSAARAAPELAFGDGAGGGCELELSSDAAPWAGCRDSGLSGKAVSAEGFVCPAADALPLRAVPGTALVNMLLNGSEPQALCSAAFPLALA